MIAPALTFLKTRLNAHLNAGGRYDDNLVALSPLHPVDEHSPEKLLLSVVSIEEDQAPKSNSRSSYTLNSSQPPLHLEITVMVSANAAQDYETALSMIDKTLSFFQANPVFSRQSDPDLPKQISRLSMEPRNLALDDQQHLWRAHGAIYRPSVAFRMRGILISSDEVGKESPRGTKINIQDDV